MTKYELLNNIINLEEQSSYPGKVNPFRIWSMVPVDADTVRFELKEANIVVIVKGLSAMASNRNDDLAFCQIVFDNDRLWNLFHSGSTMDGWPLKHGTRPHTIYLENIAKILGDLRGMIGVEEKIYAALNPKDSDGYWTEVRPLQKEEVKDIINSSNETIVVFNNGYSLRVIEDGSSFAFKMIGDCQRHYGECHEGIDRYSLITLDPYRIQKSDHDVSREELVSKLARIVMNLPEGLDAILM